MQLVVIHSDSGATDAEFRLAKKLGVPLVAEATLADQQGQDQIRFALGYDSEGLCLHGLHEPDRGRIQVNFNSPQLRRRAQEPLGSQPLGKAIGLSKQRNLQILDGTAGFATDSFLLAQAGCEVTALERSGLVHALVTDALTRVAKEGAYKPAALERLQYTEADFLHYPASPASFDVVYLDPMFPAERRTAKSKKSMHFLQQLLDKPANEKSMLDQGLRLARSRVVVKRGRHAAPLGGIAPTIQFPGKANRFDVYLVST